MTIEFSCPHCGKALTTSADKAGRKAKCPQCREVIVVPITSEKPLQASADADHEVTIDQQTCPLCGAVQPASARKCSQCGEDLRPEEPSGARRPQRIQAGDVVSTSWKIFQAEMGQTIGGVIVFYLLTGACGIPSNMLNTIASTLESEGEQDAAAIFGLLSLMFLPLSVAGQIFFQVGLTRLLLNIARGQQAPLSDLFSGAQYFWRMLGASILYGLMIAAGTLACIIPGIILGLMFLPYTFVLVDQNVGVLECLSRAKDITKNNLLALVWLVLVSFGINLLGMLALCVGLIFTVPLSMLFLAVAYCKMTGQRTAA